MNTSLLHKTLLLIGGAALVALAHRAYGWPGLALVLGGVVMWLLLHFTRLMRVLRRAAQRPVGHVDSAVMLHARLGAGLSLLQVIGLTRALGEQRSPHGQQPEVFRWTDASGAWVDAEFHQGRLRQWAMQRPSEGAAAHATEAVPPAA